MKSANREEKDLLRTTFDLVDSLVELYLKSAIAPFLKLHEKFYTGLNKVLRQVLDSNEIPTWFTANFITYGRTLLVFPTILLLASEYQILPALLAIFVDFGDFLDGVVARYWVDQDNKKVARESRSASPTSDKDSFGECFFPFSMDSSSIILLFPHRPTFIRIVLSIIYKSNCHAQKS